MCVFGVMFICVVEMIFGKMCMGLELFNVKCEMICLLEVVNVVDF